MQTIQMPLSPHPQNHPCSRFKSLDPISVLSRSLSWPGRGRLTTSTHTSGPPSPLSGGFCRSNNWKLQNDDANPDRRWQLSCFVSRSGKVARRGPWRREKIHRLSRPFAAFCCFLLLLLLVGTCLCLDRLLDSSELGDSCRSFLSLPVPFHPLELSAEYLLSHNPTISHAPPPPPPPSPHLISSQSISTSRSPWFSFSLPGRASCPHPQL